jgi:L-2,4-diaminobutyrate decarboxylase
MLQRSDKDPRPEFADDFRVSRELLDSGSDLLESNGSGPNAASRIFADELVERGIGAERALKDLAPFLRHAQRLGAPGFFAHIDPPTPVVSWIGSPWVASQNQNLLHADTGAFAQELERRVVRWLAPFFGADGGHMVPGATVANLSACWAAHELQGVTDVVASAAAHVSITKAARLMGLRLHRVETDESQRLSPTAVPNVCPSRTALVLTAGTTGAGAVEPLRAHARRGLATCRRGLGGTTKADEARRPACRDRVRGLRERVRT